MEPTEIVAPADTAKERGSLGAPPVVKEEDILGETLLILLPNRTLPAVDTSNVFREEGNNAEEKKESVDGAMKLEEPEEEAAPLPPLFLPAPQPCEVTIKTEEPEEGDDDVIGEGDPAVQSPQFKTDNDGACKLCGEEARNACQHVERKHLQQPLFNCPLCQMSSYNSTSTIALHIKRKHPNAVGALPISNRAKYAAEIQQLQARCFPSRRVKRPASSTERRYECKICHAEVASTHRQSHVYKFHQKIEALFQCPLCDFSSHYVLAKVVEHIKWAHKKEYGKVKPISHEKQHEKEILATNERCFPGWRRITLGKVKTLKQKTLAGGTAELEAEDDGEEKEEAETGSKLPSGSDTNSAWNGATAKKKKMKIKWTPIAKLATSGRLPSGEREILPKEIEANLSKIRDRLGPVSSEEEVEREGIQEVFPKELQDSSVDSNMSGMEPTEIVAPADTAEERGSFGAPRVVKEEDIFGETLLILLPNRTLPSVDTSSVSRKDDSTVAKEAYIGDYYLYPHPPLFLPNPQPGQGALKMEEPEEEDYVMKEEDSALQSPQFNTANDWACKLCGEETRHPGQHVMRKHLQQPIYQCPLCPMSSNNTTSVISYHIKTMHPNAVGTFPINNGAKVAGEIQRLQMSCFPSRQLKRMTNRTHQRYKCKMCSVEVSHSSRQCHVYSHHLKVLPMFQCPLCNFSSHSQLSQVMKHVKLSHKKEFGKVKPISHEKKHEKDILAMNERCFPGWQRKNIGMVMTLGPRKSVAGNTAEVETEDDDEVGEEVEKGSESSSGANSNTDWEEAVAKKKKFHRSQ